MNGVGGSERMTITISNFFDSNNYEVKYVLVQKGDDRILQFMKQDIPVIKMPLKRIYFSTFPIYRILKEERPDVVFCASPAINARLIIAAKMIGNIRIVVRNSNMFDFERKDVQYLMKLTYKWADIIIMQQDQMREDLHKKIKNLPQEKTITLHNPIDIDHITEGIKAPTPYPKGVDSINFLWVARFAIEKGQDLLVKAFAQVHKTHSNAHLWLVGRYNPESEYTAGIITLIHELQIEDYVHIEDHDANPYKWMMYCDCFVLPSRFEGLPNALIEAMYLGKPVVSTKCLDIINEMVVDGVNGYTCSVESPEELADAMVKALSLKDCKMLYKPASKGDFIKTITVE